MDNLKIYKIMWKLDNDYRYVHCVAKSKEHAIELFNDYILNLKEVLLKLKYYKPVILLITCYDIKLGIF